MYRFQVLFVNALHSCNIPCFHNAYSNRNDGALFSFSIEVFRTDPRLKATFPKEPGELCYKTEATLGPTTYNWNCSTPVIGRYVRLVR
jgi:hypothetical protein